MRSGDAAVRWLIRGLVSLVLLGLLAAGIFVMMPSDRIAAMAVAEFNRLTGRQLVVTGTSAPSFWPTFGVRTGPVTLSNAGWSDSGPMLAAEGLDISVDMAALLSGTVRIRGIEAVRPVIRLERNAKGQANWEFGGTNGGTVSSATPGVGKGFALDKATVTDGTLIFADATSATRLELAALTGTIAIPDYQGEAKVNLTGRRGGQAFALDLTLGAFQGFLDGQDVATELTLGSGAADLAFSGKAGQGPLRASGRLKADLADLKAITALAGLSAPSLPPGFGQRQVVIDGTVNYAGGPDIRLADATVTLDGTAMAVSAHLAPGDARPFLAADIVAGAFDLGGTSGGQGKAGPAAGGAGWSTAPIDASALGLVDTDVSVETGAVRVGGLRLDGLTAHVTSDRGRLVADLARVAAYGGTASGQVVVNARKGLSASGNLALTGIALQPLLHDVAGYDRLSGSGDVRLKVLATGRSVGALMHSVEGAGSLSIGPGELSGADLTAMLLTLDASQFGQGRKTIFDGLTASFAIAGGVLSNDDLRLASPRVTAAGQGRVGLGERTLDYRLRATALAGEAGDGGVSAPLVIFGSWDKPRFSIDLEALAKEDLKGDLGKVEDQAKAALQDELGITPNPGESLEDAARRKAEEALGGALIDLLGGN